MIWNVSHILAFVLEKFDFLSVIKCPLSNLCFDMIVSTILLMKVERGKAGTGRSLEACWPADLATVGKLPSQWETVSKKQMRVPKDQHLKLSLPSTYLPYAMWMCIQQETSSRTLRYHVFLLLPSFYMRNSYITFRSQIAYQIISLIFFSWRVVTQEIICGVTGVQPSFKMAK